jgi:hypothetical protein
MTRFTLTALILAVALAPAGAEARKKKPNYLWATVNICDTPKHPDTLGVRARMPGNGRHQRMYMRFTAQFQGKGWERVARSNWEYAGSALFTWQESGHTFPFDKPMAGVSYLTRGYVEFQWRAKRKHRKGWWVVRRAHKLTEAGHHPTRNADPKQFSAARCRIGTPAA